MSFIISLLQYGRAETWKIQYQADHTDAAGTITWPTLAAFTADLVNTFEDPNLAEKSYRKFEELRQGTMTADEFFSHFDILRSRAGLTGPAGQEYMATETAATLAVIATLSTVTKRRYHGICR